MLSLTIYVRTADHAHISVAAWDERWDGQKTRSLVAVCLRATETLLVFSVNRHDDGTMGAQPVTQLPAHAVCTVRATRDSVADLLVLRPDGTLALLTHGTYEIPLSLRLPNAPPTVINIPRVVALEHAAYSSVSIQLVDGSFARISLDLVARDHLVSDSMVMLSMMLPPDEFFRLHSTFLSRWSTKRYSFILGVEFEVLESSLLNLLGLEDEDEMDAVPADAWTQLASTESASKFREDPVLRNLQVPSAPLRGDRWKKAAKERNQYIGAALHALHLVAEEKRVFLPSIEGLPRITPLICRLALVVRPEWADYWKRYCPSAMPIWPDPVLTGKLLRLRVRFSKLIGHTYCSARTYRRQPATLAGGHVQYPLRPSEQP